MDITLHPDDISLRYNSEGNVQALCATESKSGTTVNITLTPELQKKLVPLQKAEKKIIADEAFERGVEEGSSCQAILELQGRDRFLAGLKAEKAENG